MPQVPYNPVPTVAPSTSAGNDYLNVQANPADFGAQVGAAASGVGRTLDQAGDMLAQHALAMQGMQNETMARDAGMKLMSDMGEANAQYRSLSGQAAVAGYQPFVQQIQQLRQSAIEAMPNPQAKQLLASQGAYLISRLTMGASDHSAQQNLDWQKQSHAASIATSTQQAASTYRNDPAALTALANSVGDSAEQIARMNGSDDATTSALVAQQKGKFWQTTLATVAADGPDGPTKAMALFNTVRSQLDGPSQEAIVQRLKPLVRGAEADSIVAGITGGASASAGPSGFENNVGNIKASPAAWDGKGTPYNGFETFATPEQGVKAAVQNMRSYAARNGGSLTLSQMVNRWAPPSENDTAGYIAGLTQATGIGANDQVPLGDAGKMAGLMKAMAAREKGSVTFGDDVFQRGADSAVNGTPLPAAPDNPAPMDEAGAIKRAVDATEGDPELQRATLSRLVQHFSIQRAATATDRADLQKHMGDLTSALLAGQAASIPEDRIRALYPPDQADDMIGKLHVAEQAGQVFRSVQWGSPDDLAKARQDLESGLGPLSTMIRQHGKPPAPGVTPGPETPEDFRQRQQIAGALEQQIAARQHALATDPASYVASNPTIQDKAAAIDPDKPASFEDYARASATLQTQLGVPSYGQHILGVPQAQNLAKTLMNTDPSKGDVGATLAGMAKTYGQAWPQVFGDMVTLGKLPREYQVMAAIPDATVRTEFQRAVAASTAKGGMAKLREDVPPADAKAIDQGVDDQLTAFRQTAAIPGLTSNTTLISTVRDSVRELAYYYGMQGMSGSDAVQKAADGILNARYDFDGTMRVPKGMLPAVHVATQRLLAGLKPGDLAPLAADTQATKAGPGLTDEQRQNVTLDAVRSRPQWIPNENDTGLVLTTKTNDGASWMVRRHDGSRIELPFAGVAQGAPVPLVLPKDAGVGTSIAP